MTQGKWCLTTESDVLSALYYCSSVGTEVNVRHTAETVSTRTSKTSQEHVYEFFIRNLQLATKVTLTRGSDCKVSWPGDKKPPKKSSELVREEEVGQIFDGPLTWKSLRTLAQNQKTNVCEETFLLHFIS